MAKMRSPLLTRDQILDAELPEGLQIMRRFKRAVDNGEMPTQDDLRALAAMFGAVDAAAAGKSPEAQAAKKALRLEAGRGRRPDTANESERKFQFAVAVELHCLDHGQGRDQAIEQVAAQRYIAEATARKWHDANREAARPIARLIAKRQANNLFNGD